MAIDAKIFSSNDDKSITAMTKLRGVYPQKQEGLFMQRIKIFGGRISWQQWRAVAQLAIRYTPQTPLHLTTRQDIEFHNIRAADLPGLQNELFAVGLSTLGAGGDSMRNVTVCTGCESCVQDVYSLAAFVSTQLDALPMIRTLPRKFKMSFSGCQKSCSKPFINDLGFVAQENGLFTAIGAGSLGPKPAIGIELYKDLSACDIVPLCRAAIDFFNACGDRENRRRARFRHIRESLGDEIFKHELDNRFKSLRGKTKTQNADSKHTTQKLNMFARLQLPNGNILAEDALALSDFAESSDLELRVNLTHGLELYSSGAIALQLPPKLAALTSLPVIVACPGCATCPNAITNCGVAAESLRSRLYGIDVKGIVIGVSGCPNDCAQCVVADIGLVGLIRTIDGVRSECYRVLTDGGKGMTSTLAKASATMPADAIPEFVAAAIAAVENDVKV